MSNELQTTGTNALAQMAQNASAIESFRIACQNFNSKLHSNPASESIYKTPDGRAQTVTISHIEMTLDELFFGLWETDNFRWAQIGNEVVGAIDLKVFHPVVNGWLKRQGAASIVIMVDKAPDSLTQQEKNQWALNQANKKSNALDMAFPKLKAECLKNAAQSLGKLFGRDLNRKKQDGYNPLIKPQQTTLEELTALFEEKKAFIPATSLPTYQLIIDTKESQSFTKLFKYLQTL